MLVNGKTQDQIASELASDLLPDGEEQRSQDFAQWLFEQVTSLKSGGEPTPVSAAQPSPDNHTRPMLVSPVQAAVTNGLARTSSDDIPAAYDTDMGEAAPGNA